MFKKVPKTDAQTTSPAANNSNRGGAGGRRGTFTRRPGRQKLTGLFADGIWHCDCDCNPRLPAERFQVKKESANKGVYPMPLHVVMKGIADLSKADGSILARMETAVSAVSFCGRIRMQKYGRKLLS